MYNHLCFVNIHYSHLEFIQREGTVAVAQEAANEIKVGDTAPDFTLKDQDQKDWTLNSFRGKKNVVLIFYPLDWSPVCTGENKCISDDFPKFEQANAEVAGISTDSFFSHKAWADALGLREAQASRPARLQGTRSSSPAASSEIAARTPLYPWKI